MVDDLEELILLRMLSNMSSEELVSFMKKLFEKLDKDILIDLYKNARDKMNDLQKKSVTIILKKSFNIIQLTELAKNRLREFGFSERDLRCYPLIFRSDPRFIKVFEELGDMFATCTLVKKDILLSPGQAIDIIEDDGIEYATVIWM